MLILAFFTVEFIMSNYKIIQHFIQLILVIGVLGLFSCSSNSPKRTSSECPDISAMELEKADLFCEFPENKQCCN